MGLFASLLGRMLAKPAEEVLAALPEEYRGAEDGSPYSYDWCRFRKNCHCMYPDRLHERATQIEGYQVWVPLDRGICPRDRWEEQKACGLAEPGPKSRERNALIECTTHWEDGGQRDGIPYRM